MSSYSNDSYNNRKEVSDEYLISLESFFNNVLNGLKKFWWILAILIIIFTAFFVYREVHGYSERYSTQASFAVTANDENITSMFDTYSYLLTSSIMEEIIADDLEMDSLPGTIEVEEVENTNFLMIKVTSSSGENAYKIMESLIENYSQVSDMMVANLVMEVVEPPEIPTEPDNKMDIVRAVRNGILVGGAVGLLIIFGYAALRKTVQKKEDIVNELHLPCIGVIPKIKIKKRSGGNVGGTLITSSKIDYHYQESYKMLRRKIESDASVSGNKVYIVTSSSQGEGKSTVATNMSLSLAEKGYRVVLIDGDIRKPTVKKLFKTTEKSAGLQDILYRGFDINDKMFITDRKTGLNIIGGDGGTKVASEVLASSAYMEALFSYLRTQFDFIIIDTPPIGLMADAKIIGEYADGAVFVVRHDFMRVSVIKESIESIWSGNIKIIGTVLNSAEKSGGRYGDYYYKSYYRYRKAR